MFRSISTNLLRTQVFILEKLRWARRDASVENCAAKKMIGIDPFAAFCLVIKSTEQFMAIPIEAKSFREL